MSDWIGGRRWEDYPRSRRAEKMSSEERYAEQAYHGPACGLGKNEGSREHSEKGAGYRENKSGSEENNFRGEWAELVRLSKKLKEDLRAIWVGKIMRIMNGKRLQDNEIGDAPNDAHDEPKIDWDKLQVDDENG